MTASAVPFTFTSNTTIASAQVNSNFAAVISDLNAIDAGQITTGTIAAARIPFAAAGQIVGTATNDNANAGNVGQIITASVVRGSAVGQANATPANVTSISLTAGDWDVNGVVWALGNAATTVNTITAGISTTSATQPTIGGTDSNQFFYASAAVFAATNDISVPVGSVRISLGVTTTVFLVITPSFAVNTLSAYGAIRARRVR